MNIKYAIDSMDDWLEKNYPYISPKKIDLSRLTTISDISGGSIKEISHLKYMITILKEIPAESAADREKLMRWVSFMQGALWAIGYFSIDNFREMNTHE